MKSLQLIRYGTVGDALAFGERPVPQPGDDQVLIKVAAAGINPLDYKMASGAMHARRPLELPRVVGFDVCGKIVELGDVVTGFKVGDTVMAYVGIDNMGTVAEYALADQSEIAKRPAALSDNEAAGLSLVALTVYQSLLDIADLKAGEKILIHAGSGGVGHVAIQIAKLRGAFVATTTSTTNTGWVGALGADLVIDYRTQNYLDVVSGYDVVFDMLGGDYTLDAFKVIRTGGRVVTLAGPMDRDTAAEIGMTLPPDAETVNAAADDKKALYRFARAIPNCRQLDEIARWCDEGLLKPVIDTVYPFADSMAAFQHLVSGRAKGKIVIELSD